MLRLVGIEDAPAPRRSVVTWSLLALLALVYVPTWHLQRDRVRAADALVNDVILYWNAHPSLSPPDEFVDRYGTAALRDHLATRRRIAPIPDSSQAGADRQRLGAMLSELGAVNASLTVERWGLVPARGLWQPGWLTYWLLHGGIRHLALNLLLLALVAPLLEDVWRRGWLAAFFAAGAVAAAACHVAFAPGSVTPLIGASGVASACFGAFTTRFANRRVTFIVHRHGGDRRFGLPCLLWGAFFFATQAWAVYRGGPTDEISFVAHLGGFGFGAVVAAAAHAAGVSPRLERPHPAEHARADSAVPRL